MAVEAVVGGVELAADEPLGEGGLPVQHGVPLLEPVQFFGQAGPESGGILGGAVVDGGVGEIGGGGESGGRREAAFFLQQGVDAAGGFNHGVFLLAGGGGGVAGPGVGRHNAAPP